MGSEWTPALHRAAHEAVTALYEQGQAENFLCSYLGPALREIERLQAENAELREALGFYADWRAYQRTNQSMMGSTVPANLGPAPIDTDNGKRAREALAPKEDEGG